MTDVIDLSEETVPARSWAPIAAWTAPSAVYAAALWFAVGVPPPFALLSALTYFYTLAALMIPVARWSDRAGSASRHTARSVAAHLGVGLIVITIWQAVNLLFLRLFVGPAVWSIVYAGNWPFQLLGALMVYGAALGFTLTAQAFRRERERERREASIRLVARDAELSAIKAQLQPHFVLNALTSLLVLIDKDPALARLMVIRLADLMNAVFDRFDVAQVPLERELDLTRAYLDIERIRFGSRLSVTIEIDDEVRAVLVPAFLLQPIVENAVKHGIGPDARPGLVSVSARLAGDRVSVVIRDSRAERGAATAAAPIAAIVDDARPGRGLHLTRRRLDTLYGPRYRLSIGPEPEGFTVRIDLPLESARVA